MKHFRLAATAILLPATAWSGPTVTETFSKTLPALIPDNNVSGLVQIITPATTIGLLDSVTVTFNTSGGWNGDLYAYLWHNSTISVLLNRPGRTAGNSSGSSGGGFLLTFDDTSSSDVHTAPFTLGTPLTGTFQPDGRNVSPFVAVDTSLRAAALSVFNGMPASGEWRLFVADVATGDQATLQSWSITLTGTEIPVPEPSTFAALAGLAGLALAVGLRRRRR